MTRCHSCHAQLSVRRLECDGCGVFVEGQFATPRLARLDAEDQQLIESFVLSGGNLKNLAEDLSISYPTLRKRVDGLIARLDELRAADERQAEEWLREVEAGRMKPEQAARLLREQAHG